MSRATAERAGEPRRPRSERLAAPGQVDVIGVCASTGGPRALEDVLVGLPADYAVPLLVVQHMARGFLDGFVSWLDKRVAISVAQAVDGDALSPGVWFAPDDLHLRLTTNRALSLAEDSANERHRPSGDVLLRSLAEAAGSRAVAVVLTGMGRDGADGLAAVAATGGVTIAQDRESSTVYGMPRVAAERGAKTILSPTEIGRALAAMDGRGR